MMNETGYRNAERAYWKHYGTTPTERWLELPVLNTKVRVQEVGEGTPLLFLHGGPSVMGCPPFIPGARMPLFLRLLATPGIGALLSRLPANRFGTMAFLDAMGQQEAKCAGLIPDEFVQWWISLGRDTNTMVNDRDLIRHGLTFQGMRFELIIPEDRLRHLPHPTYVYWGEDDPLAERSYAERLFPFMLKGSIDFIPNSGHLPWLDNPADAAARTREFLLS